MGNVLRKILRWVAIFLGVLLGLAALAVVGFYYITEERINKTYDVSVAPLDIPTDPASVERGRHLVEAIGLCAECHGEDYSGEALDDDPMMGLLNISNLTSGVGGVGARYTDLDWVRAIRHGLKPDGKSLIAMPANYYRFLSDEDLAAMIAYLKSLPPVDREGPKSRLGPMARFVLLQDPSLLPADIIDHNAPRPPAPEPGVSKEYGQYLASVCQVCHGPDMAGGEEPGAGMNLTPGGDLASWTEQDFFRALRTGITPDGTELDPEMMPWVRIGQMSDDELMSIWLYLKSLPPVETPSFTENPAS